MSHLPHEIPAIEELADAYIQGNRRYVATSIRGNSITALMLVSVLADAYGADEALRRVTDLLLAHNIGTSMGPPPDPKTWTFGDGRYLKVIPPDSASGNRSWVVTGDLRRSFDDDDANYDAGDAIRDVVPTGVVIDCEMSMFCAYCANLHAAQQVVNLVSDHLEGGAR